MSLQFKEHGFQKEQVYKCKPGSVIYLRISEFLVWLDEAEKPNRKGRLFTFVPFRREL